MSSSATIIIWMWASFLFGIFGIRVVLTQHTVETEEDWKHSIGHLRLKTILHWFITLKGTSSVRTKHSYRDKNPLIMQLDWCTIILTQCCSHRQGACGHHQDNLWMLLFHQQRCHCHSFLSVLPCLVVFQQIQEGHLPWKYHCRSAHETSGRVFSLLSSWLVLHQRGYYSDLQQAIEVTAKIQWGLNS